MTVATFDCDSVPSVCLYLHLRQSVHDHHGCEVSHSILLEQYQSCDYALRGEVLVLCKVSYVFVMSGEDTGNIREADELEITSGRDLQ